MANSNIVVNGGSGSGKTLYVKKRLLKKLKSMGIKVGIVDVEDEYGDIADARVQHPDQFDQAFKQGHDLVRIEPELSMRDQELNGEILDDIIAGITRYDGLVCILVEEAHNFQTNRKVYSDYLYKVMKQGRKYGIMVIQVSQEPQDLHRSTWNNSEYYIVFRVDTVPDKLEKKLDPDDPHPEKIPRYHYLVVQADVYTDNVLKPPLEI